MRIFKSLAIASAALFAAAQGHAQTYVGSWQVDQGANWGTVPAAYSGLDAAALLFGGSPTDYLISTIGNDPGSINNLAWISTWGGACGGTFPCGTQVAANFVDSTGGLYSSEGDTSAYVQDWAIGAQYTNYAFRIAAAVPEPGTWAMMLVGFGGMGVALRRRRRLPAITQLA